MENQITSVAAKLSRAEKRNDLIYDVGMHKGEDTDFYLKKGFRVVGFEADPELAHLCRTRFPDAIRENRLAVVEGAIIDRRSIDSGQKTVTFFRNRGISFFGSVMISWADERRRGNQTVAIEVPAVDFGACLLLYGVPYYMKIDIEGMDWVCLECLRECAIKPDYLSIEAEILDSTKLTREIDRLHELGYSAFKAVQQNTVTEVIPANPPLEGIYAPHCFEAGSSGVFGRELPGEWKSYLDILEDFKHIMAYRRVFGVDSFLCRTALSRKIVWRLLGLAGRRPPGWYDTHARHECAGQ